MIQLKTLFITDLDGTLFDPSGKLGNETANIINPLIAEGLSFTFATARTVYSAAPLTSALNINVPCILMNGVSLYDLKDKRYVSNEFMSGELLEKLVRIFDRHNTECFVFKNTNGILTTYFTRITQRVMSSYAENRKMQYGKPFVHCRSFLDICDDTGVYIAAIGEHSDLLPVKNEISSLGGADCAFYKDVYCGKWYLEVFSKTASKANGIKKLRKLYGFERVVAFGDNLNDLPMFEEADISVAVENARDEVKAAADIVIGSNDRNGVAEWLRGNAHNI